MRHNIYLQDIDTVRSLVQKAGVFSNEEVSCAAELVQESLGKGEAESGYSFVFAEDGGTTGGYACYGAVPLTSGGYDLYWIVVDNAYRHKGVGAALLEHVENAVKARGGTHLYAETSSLPDYTSARAFYLKNGFVLSAQLSDFYKPGDDKIIFTKNLRSKE